MSAHTFDSLMAQIDHPNTLNGDLKKIAKEIKKDHELAIQLWESEKYNPRLLSVLIMDKKQLSLDKLEAMTQDLLVNDQKEQNHVGDWLLANQLIKAKGLVALLEGFEDHPSPFLRRLFWYYQARLRWTGKLPHDNTGQLVASIAKKLGTEDPEVQMAMNFCAGWIGVYDKEYADQVLQIGEEVGLYRGDKVPKGCAPPYLPEFIEYENERLSKLAQKGK